MNETLTTTTLDGFAREFIETDDGFFWTVSNVVLAYIESQYPDKELHGKRLLELGSGLGDLAVALQKRGAIMTCSDGPWALEVLQARTQAIGIRTVPLLWGQQGQDNCQDVTDQIMPEIDLVIGSELIGDDRFHDDLVYTLQQILPVGVPLLHAYADRPFSGLFFAKLDEAGFDVEDIVDFDCMGLDPDRVAINWIRRRSATKATTAVALRSKL